MAHLWTAITMGSPASHTGDRHGFMAAFDDSTDPVLGAACNRLAAFCEALPQGALVDRASGLTEPDLVVILRSLYGIRQQVSVPVVTMDEAAATYGRPPVTLDKREARQSPWSRNNDA